MERVIGFLFAVFFFIHNNTTIPKPCCASNMKDHKTIAAVRPCTYMALTNHATVCLFVCVSFASVMALNHHYYRNYVVCLGPCSEWSFHFTLQEGYVRERGGGGGGGGGEGEGDGEGEEGGESVWRRKSYINYRGHQYMCMSSSS